jgi:hypothetical protein
MIHGLLKSLKQKLSYSKVNTRELILKRVRGYAIIYTTFVKQNGGSV